MDVFEVHRQLLADYETFTSGFTEIARTKKAILETYDALADAVRTGEPYRATLDPPPGNGPRHAAPAGDRPADTDVRFR